MDNKEIVREIARLKKEKNAVILSHYYVNPEVQDIADYIGDSFGLSQMAAQTDASMILFCGVRFMAETASIISPDKTVLLPDLTAGCSLAESVTPDDIIKWKKNNPDGIVVSYVNTTAEVKAHTDICCTSANAAHVINSIPNNKKILFGPDRNLAQFVKVATGREFDIWNGDCCVHEDFTTSMVLKAKEQNPDAELLIHPESSCSHDPVIYSRPDTFILSTSGMIRRAGESKSERFIIVTEPGVIHQMKLMYPDKQFIAADSLNKCFQMRKVTLQKVLKSLQQEIYKVEVPADIREKAAPSIKKMLLINN
jgi:quinolinate synthase